MDLFGVGGFAFGAVGVVVGIAGVVLTVHYARRSEAFNKLRKRLEWADLLAASNDLGKRLKSAGFQPDIIVTPGLRGATFSNLLISEFNKEPIVYVGISTWKDGQAVRPENDADISINTKKWSVSIPGAVKDITTGNILIVDDFVMSGDFLDSLIEALLRLDVKPDRIRSAAIAATKVAVKNHKAPAYYWWLAEDDDFYFPWGKAR